MQAVSPTGRHVSTVEVIAAERRNAPSKHYVYKVVVMWSDGSELTIYRRYSKFFEFHQDILDTFPQYAGDPKTGRARLIPFLPGKKIFGRSSTHHVADQRLPLLNSYIQSLMLLPDEISKSKIVTGYFEPTHDDMNHLAAKPTKAKVMGEVGNVLMLDQYVVVADYKKVDKNELGISEGQIVEVIEKKDNGWWFVQVDDGGGKGWVPATFLESAEEGGGEVHAEEMPAGGEKFISKQAYKAAEEDEVSFPKAAVVLVKEKKLDGWWQVEYEGKAGWAPGAYLQLLAKDRPPPIVAGGAGGAAPPLPRPEEAFSPVSKEPPTRRQSIMPTGFDEVAKALAASTMAANAAAPAPSDLYVTLEAYEAEDEGGVSFPEGVNVMLIEKAESGWWCVEYNGVEGWAPADYLAPAAASGGAAAAAAAAPPASFVPAPAPAPAPAAAAAVPPPRPPSPTHAAAAAAGPARPPAPTPAAAAAPAAAAPTHQVATDFFAGSESEVSVSAGELVTFSEANEGWWFVVKEDGAEGWAPADYFEDIGATDFNSDDGAGGSGGGDDDDELPAEPAELYLVEDDFAGEADDQLSVKKGDTIKLLEANEGGWWWMEAADGSAAGWVPSDYVVKL